MVLHLAARVPPFDACPEFFPDVLALVNDKEVSDHHALIPTLELEKAMCLRCAWASAISFCWSAASCCVRRRSLSCMRWSRPPLIAAAYLYGKRKAVLSQGWRAIQEVFRSSLKEKPVDEDAEVSFRP